MVGAGPAQAATPQWMALFRAINKVRASHGLHPIAISTRLHVAARRHSHDMLWRGYFAHTSPTGSTLTQRILNSGFLTFGYWEAGETLAWGTGSAGTPAGVVNMWMHSPEHRAILLSPSFTRIGISRACGHFLGHVGACVWTADWVERW